MLATILHKTERCEGWRRVGPTFTADGAERDRLADGGDQKGSSSSGAETLSDGLFHLVTDCGGARGCR